MRHTMRHQSMRIMLLAGCLAASTAAHAGFQWTAPINGSGAPSVVPNARPAELPPRAAAAPVAPVMTETLPGNLGAINAGAPIPTTPDGPANAAPIFGNGMTNDPITWNQPRSAPQPVTHQTAGYAPRAPQNIMAAESVPLAANPQPVTMQPVMAQPNWPPVMAQPVMVQPAVVQQQPIMAQPVVQTSGYGMYDVAQGFGRDLPLVMAIRQIVPPQYGFVFADGIDVSAKVSWQGGQPWDIVLQNTLGPLGMTGTIHGNTVAIARQGAQPAMMQHAAATTGGPQLMTDMMAGGGSMTMAATPIAMTAPAAMPAPIIDDMSGVTGYTNVAQSSGQVDLMANSTWTAPRNSTLRTILEGWAERVGVELYWSSEYDYPVQSAVSVQGTFEEAVQTLLKGLSESRPRPMGRLHPNLPNGPAVLVIETRQNSM